MSKKGKYMLGVEADYSAGFHLPISRSRSKSGASEQLGKMPMIGTLKYTWKRTDVQVYFPELLKESVTCGQKVGCVQEAHPSVISQGKRWPGICLLKWHRLYLKNSGSGTITAPLVFIYVVSSPATLLHPHPSYREFSSKCWRAIIENYQHLGTDKWWRDLSPLSSQPWHYQASLALALTASPALVLTASVRLLLWLSACLLWFFLSSVSRLHFLKLLISCSCFKAPNGFPPSTQWGPIP